MSHSILSEIALILGLSLGALWVCHRIGVPEILGYLLIGALAGPSALGVIRSVEQVEAPAEIGVVLLLFTIGIEFPLSSLLRRTRTLLVGGGGQVALTALAAGGLAVYLGQPGPVAVVIGFVVALSSTAVVLSSLQRAGALDQAHGRAALSVLIFQDLAVVPMMAVLPALAVAGGGEGSVLGSVARAVGALAVVLLAARKLVPALLAQMVATRSRELFLLTIVAICLTVAWAASLAGLSLALGAFLAGLLVSESEYSHQALGVVIPLRDVFTAFFFVSIGMLFDLRLLVEAPAAVGLAAAGVVAGKALIALVVALILRLPLVPAVLTGLALAQIGEFSFILARAAVQLEVMSEDLYQWILAVAVLTIAVTPILIVLGPRIGRLLERAPWPRWLTHPADLDAEREAGWEVSGHVVIVGWGVTGRLVARSCAIARIPYRGVELNPETVLEAREQGEPVLWGDAAMDPILERVGVTLARAVVVSVPDASAMRQIVGAVHRLNPGVRVIVRTRLAEEIDELVRLGADDVIPQEWEAAVRIVDRLLDALLVPRHEVQSFLSSLRSSGYEALRGPEMPRADGLPEKLGGAEIVTLEIQPGSELAGLTLAEANLRRLYGVSALAVNREDGFVANPAADTRLEPGDQVVVLGLPDELAAVAPLFGSEPAPD